MEKQEAMPPKVNGGVDGGLLNVFGVLNWELDIWGKLRHQSRSSVDEFLASKTNRDALQVSLVAEVASDYFLLRDLDNRLMISQSTLEGRRVNTKLISDKFESRLCFRTGSVTGPAAGSYRGALSVSEFRRQIILTENAITRVAWIGTRTY